MSDLPQLRPETIQLASNIVVFARTGNKVADKVNAEVFKTAHFITQYYLGSTKQPIEQPTNQRRNRSQGSIESFPPTWVVDPPSFKWAVAAFTCDTLDIRGLQPFHDFRLPNESSTPRGSTSDEPDPPSDQSERLRRSSLTKEIPREASLSPNQFPGTGPSMAANNPINNMTQDQLDQLVKRAIARALVAHQAGPPGSSGPPGSPGDTINSTHWKASELGLFYPNLPLHEGEGDVVDKNNKIYYRNVHFFTNRVRVAAFTRDASIIRKNLDSCLRGEAELWWNNQLDKVT